MVWAFHKFRNIAPPQNLKWLFCGTSSYKLEELFSESDIPVAKIESLPRRRHEVSIVSVGP